MNKKRGQIALEKLVYWIIALIVLILGFVIIMILSGKGQGAIDYLKNLFQFGR